MILPKGEPMERTIAINAPMEGSRRLNAALAAEEKYLPPSHKGSVYEQCYWCDLSHNLQKGVELKWP